MTNVELELVLTERVVGIIREHDADAAGLAVETLLEAGMRVVEVSLVTPGALSVIAEFSARVNDDILIGVGTALSARDVAAAGAAGARFMVSPIVDVGAIEEATHQGMLAIPGVATPTEAELAHRAGAALQKLFPAASWTPAAMRDVLIAMPHLRLVPTGGISVEAASDWLRAGAAAVGMGSALLRGSRHESIERIAMLRSTLASGVTHPGR